MTEVVRCGWALKPGLDQDYHDTEWGTPIAGEAAWFERLTLEAFQSGLSWSTILHKRENFRAAFHGFDVDAVAAFDDADYARLMADAGIVRNRLKVNAAMTNACAIRELRADGGLEALIRSHAPTESPVPRSMDDVPAVTAESKALAKALKKAGLVFVGPTTMYALMQATGLVNDHLADCFRRDQVSDHVPQRSSPGAAAN